MWRLCANTRYWWRLNVQRLRIHFVNYNDVIMGTIASQITSLTIVYSAVYSDADQRKYQSSASLAFVRGIHRRTVNSPHKWPVTRKMFPFDDFIMIYVLSTYDKNGNICRYEFSHSDSQHLYEITLHLSNILPRPCFGIVFTVLTHHSIVFMCNCCPRALMA